MSQQRVKSKPASQYPQLIKDVQVSAQTQFEPEISLTKIQRTDGIQVNSGPTKSGRAPKSDMKAENMIESSDFQVLLDRQKDPQESQLKSSC